MEGHKKGSLKGRQNASFKRKGISSKQEKWGNYRPGHVENTQVPNPTDTVYRILCPSKKIGGVIGKGGGIIKALREETKSKITISDSIRGSGSDERVIMIYSPSDKSSGKEIGEGDEVGMRAHCPAQEALMRVHDRIIEEELAGGKGNDEEKDSSFTARLLVPNNMVGCVLGKGGDVIQRLRTETGASIRVLPSEHLPSCALPSDELVQMQGKPTALKRALYEVSTLLHQNPRKEKALNFFPPSRAPPFHDMGPLTNMPPRRGADPMWSPRDPSRRMPPPPPWIDDYRHQLGYNQGAFDDDLTGPGVEHSGEFCMKILCLASKIGGVIGKGGLNVRQLQEETGTSIHVEDGSTESEDRVIRVSAFETLENQRSQTIDAILILQNKVSDISEKGVITTRLLVPSNKVGCLLGQGGTVINEMRRRTQADIRVHSKDEKPNCALEDEELVQVSGSIAVAKDALGEIASRLRARYLRDVSGVVELTPPPPPSRPVQEYGPPLGFPPRGPPVGYNVPKGGMHDYEPPSYSHQPSASRYPNSTGSMEAHYPNNRVGSAPEAPGIRKHHDPYLGPDPMAENRGGSDRYPAPPINYNYNGLNNPPPSSYPDPKGQSYHSIPPQQGDYQSPYQNHHHQPPYQSSYQDNHQPPYQNSFQNHQPSYQSSYQNHQPPYQSQSPYGNMNAQHGAYQSAVAAQGSYQY